MVSNKLHMRHFGRIKNARVIETDAMLATIEMMSELRETTCLGTVIGNPGAGKTFSMASAIERMPGLDYVYITFPPETTSRLVSQKLLEALTGEAATKIERNEALRLRARDILMSRQPMVIGDEAQNLGRNGIEGLRYMHDICDCSFPILLCGGEGCWKVLSAEKMLKSRIHEYVAHRLFDEEDVVNLMPGYHPVWERVDEDLIRMIDRRRCRGEFRLWAGFTAKAERYLERNDLDSVDREIVLDLLDTCPPN